MDSKLIKLAFFVLMCAIAAHAQTFPNAPINGPGQPVNPCTNGLLYTDTLTGNLWSCKAGAWNNTTGSGGGIAPPAGDIGGSTGSPTVISTHLGAPLPVVQGGTGTATPSLVQGSNIVISGLWPNQTINASGSLVSLPNPLVSGSLTTAPPWKMNVDVASGGTNPSWDIRGFGARVSNPNATPNIPGITANTTVGFPTAFLSAASTFQNGDGVTIFKAGPNKSLGTPTAPTVAYSLAASLTSTGVDVAAPTVGSPNVSWCYRLVGVDAGRGMSIESSATCVNVPTLLGVPVIGPANVAITGSSQSNNTVTITTAARSPEVLAVGMTINIYPSGTTPGYWETIATVPGNTSFTFTTGEDLRSGAASNTGFTGGTVNYWTSNKLTLPAPPTNVIQYIIYRSTDGGTTYAPVHLTYPINNSLVAANEPTYLLWDDYGATMSGNETFPYWIPATPPVATTPDSLTTTIVAGQGTTTLTLAANASTSASGATILLDACPGIQGAFAAAQSNFGMVYIPAPGPFVTNSLCDLSTYAQRIGVSQAGQLSLNDTLKTGNSSWYGNLTPSNLLTPSFAITAAQEINVLKANPGIWAVGTDEVFWNDVFINGGTNGYVLMFVDGGALPTGILKDVSFNGGTTADRTGVDLYLSGGNGIAAPSGFQIINMLASTGSPQSGAGGGQGLTASPVVVSKNMGQFFINGLYMSARGEWYQPASEGAELTIDGKYEMQGSVTPYLTTYAAGGVTGGYVELKQPVMDTSSNCILFNSAPVGDFSAVIDVAYAFPGSITTCGNPFTSIASKSVGTSVLGQTTNTEETISGSAIDGTFVTNNSGNTAYAIRKFRKGVEIDSPYSIHSNNGTTAACTAVSSGASGPFTGTVAINVVPVFPDNGEGSTSSSCSVSGLSSNGINLSYLAVPGALGYDVYANGTLSNLNSCAVPQVTGLSVTLAGSFTTCGPAQPNVPGSGATGMNANELWAPKLNLPPLSGAPSTLANGDVWTTSAGIFVRVGGSTVGPLGSGGGGSTVTVGTFTQALGTSAIASGACASVLTTAVSGALATDSLLVDFAGGDPTGVTGYNPATGEVQIFKFMTTGNANIRVCNPTGVSITPGAMTLNGRVVR